jgi:hypothetical protein
MEGPTRDSTFSSIGQSSKEILHRGPTNIEYEFVCSSFSPVSVLPNPRWLNFSSVHPRLFRTLLLLESDGLSHGSHKRFSSFLHLKKKSHSRAFQAETSWTASAGAVGFRPWCQNYLSVVQCAVNCAVVNNHQSSFPNFPLKDPGIFRTAHIPPCSPSEAQYKPSNNFSPILSKYVIAATPLC